MLYELYLNKKCKKRFLFSHFNVENTWAYYNASLKKPGELDRPLKVTVTVEKNSIMRRGGIQIPVEGLWWRKVTSAVVRGRG